jgi:hypothetical protein
VAAVLFSSMAVEALPLILIGASAALAVWVPARGRCAD